MSVIKTYKVENLQTRTEALQVITTVYLQEKNWIRQPENEIPENIAESNKYSCFWPRLMINRPGLSV